MSAGSGRNWKLPRARIQAAKSNMRQYILIHEDGWGSDECGQWEELEATKSKDSCAKKAREGGYPAFAFGKDFAFGSCYGEVIRVTQKYFDKYEVDPENPAPACGKQDSSSCPDSCIWLENPYFNTYVINPTSMGKQKAE